MGYKYINCESEAWVIKFLRENPNVDIISITAIATSSLGSYERTFVIFYKD